MRPARRNIKGDVARRNRDLIAKGATKAVDEGDIKIEDFEKLQRNIRSYELAI